MPTILTHAVVPLALGIGLGAGVVSRRLLFAGAVAAIMPDFDVVAFKLGIAYADAFGHRGASHSLAFALLLGLLALACSPLLRTSRLAAFVFVTLSTLSHPVLDMFTNGGLGVAMWWPLASERLFAPWRVIEVSPIGVTRFLTERGLAVLRSEFVWVCLPAIGAGTLLASIRLGRARGQTDTLRSSRR
jgi:inner membrane protein